MTSRSAIEECHCLTKHLLHAEGHIEEMIANAAASGHKDLVYYYGSLLDQIRAHRKDVMNKAIQMEQQGIEFQGCSRCEGQLQGLGAPRLEARRGGYRGVF